jgi:adenylate cyclase class 2
VSHEEVEVKLAIGDSGAALARIRAARFEIVAPRVFEQNVVLDTTSRTLRQQGLLLRLRRAGDSVTCTLKGQEVPGPHKRREEREFRASDFDEVLAVFHGLGYSPTFRYDKYRTELARPGEPGHVTVDETPVGAYLELEGPAPWIDRTAKDLGFTPGDYILASYGRLYAEWREKHPEAPADMIFEPATRK